jgi:hypothetical protein
MLMKLAMRQSHCVFFFTDKNCWLALCVTQIDAEALQQRALASGYRVVLDMAFRELMTEKERLSMRSQVCTSSFCSTAVHVPLSQAIKLRQKMMTHV